MALLSVENALARVLDGVEPFAVEAVPVERAQGRVLAEPLAALLSQPPFPASAMDGYAVRAADVGTLPATLRTIGTAAAGHPFAGKVGQGEAVRIFTGAPVPDGADAIVIQENTVSDGATVVVREGNVEAEHLRPEGMDFRAGEVLLPAGRPLTARDLALAAAMGHGTLAVRRHPRVAILSTGDELVPPGAQPGPGQIVACNHLTVAGLVAAAGAEAILIGIARDTRADLARHLGGAGAADILVTIGGASVGDHDLVAPALTEHGMSLAFWKINMRPGKPLMFGRMGATRVLGLPGNPAAALVGARLFLVPLLWRLLGRDVAACVEPLEARLAASLERNGSRQRYLSAVRRRGADGLLHVVPSPHQHSSLVAPLAHADCLVLRPPDAPAAAAGAPVPILPLDV
jgi:molybdopterin molybdotransferase